MFDEQEYLDCNNIFPNWCDIGKYENNRLNRKIELGAVNWQVEDKQEHYDHVEMSGAKASVITSYGADDNSKLKLHHHLVFPSRRTIPNDTHGSLAINFSSHNDFELVCDREISGLKVSEINFDGTLVTTEANEFYQKQRRIFASTDRELVIEVIDITNISSETLSFSFNDPLNQKGYSITDLETEDCLFVVELITEKQMFKLQGNQGYRYYQLYKINQTIIDVEKELSKRFEFIDSIDNRLILKTPNPVLNELFKFSKRRLCESIYETSGGLMHSPGGGRYYAALWTNDQCEYANPIFPLIGYTAGNEQSLNCYRLFAKYMDPNFKKPLVSSIVAEGKDIWDGAGDRGDAAMYGSGAARFVLELGDEQVTEELLPAIEWCVAYCEQNINAYGVLNSDSDELENRFESGNANLASSCLLYDLYINAANLYQGKRKGDYQQKAQELKEAINSYFGAEVEGYKTYKYYEKNETLRSWICLPLVFGISERKEETAAALFSQNLWTANGLRTDSQNNETFWDRSTLFALRGLFSCCDAESAYQKLVEFSSKRLLGNHIPYVVEAYPEGNQKHLSAESALYLKVFIHGIFGLNSVGNSEWKMKLNPPKLWETFALDNIYLNDKQHNIRVSKEQSSYVVKIISSSGSEVNIKCEKNQEVIFSIKEK